MLVIVMLTAIGALALNAASYDMASAGVISELHAADSIAGGGVALARTEMYESIDGIVLAMDSMRTTQGTAAGFEMNQDVLADQALPGQIFETSETAGETERDSFGNVYDAVRTANPPQISVNIERPRETDDGISGFSIRESSGADSASFCFRNFRVTSDGTFVPPSSGAGINGTTARHVAYIVTGPMECSN